MYHSRGPICNHPRPLGRGLVRVWSGPVRSCSVLSCPVRFDPVRSGSVRSGPVQSGPVRSGPVRSGPVRSGPVRSSLVRSGPVRVRSGLVRSRSGLVRDGARPVRFGSVRFGSVRFGSVRSGPVRSGPDRTTPDRSRQDRTGQDRTGPDRTRPERTAPNWTELCVTGPHRIIGKNRTIAEKRQQMLLGKNDPNQTISGESNPVCGTHPFVGLSAGLAVGFFQPFSLCTMRSGSLWASKSLFSGTPPFRGIILCFRHESILGLSVGLAFAFFFLFQAFWWLLGFVVAMVQRFGGVCAVSGLKGQIRNNSQGFFASGAKSLTIPAAFNLQCHILFDSYGFCPWAPNPC